MQRLTRRGLCFWLTIAVALGSALLPQPSRAQADCGSGEEAQCLERQFRDAEQRLAGAYKQKLVSLDGKAQRALRAAEVAWIKQRDATCGSASKQTTMEGWTREMLADPGRARCLIRLANQRATELAAIDTASTRPPQAVVAATPPSDPKIAVTVTGIENDAVGAPVTVTWRVTENVPPKPRMRSFNEIVGFDTNSKKFPPPAIYKPVLEDASLIDRGKRWLDDQRLDFVVVSVPNTVRFKGEGFLVIPPGEDMPFKVKFEPDRMRAVFPLYLPESRAEGSLIIRPLAAGRFDIKIERVTTTNAGELRSTQTLFSSVGEHVDRKPVTIVQDRYQTIDPEGAFRSEDNKFCLRVFPRYFEVFDCITEIISLRRSGFGAKFSTSGRFLTYTEHNTVMIDLLSNEDIYSGDDPLAYFTHTDGYAALIGGGYGRFGSFKVFSPFVDAEQRETFRSDDAAGASNTNEHDIILDKNNAIIIFGSHLSDHNDIQEFIWTINSNSLINSSTIIRHDDHMQKELFSNYYENDHNKTTWVESFPRYTSSPEDEEKRDAGVPVHPKLSSDSTYHAPSAQLDKYQDLKKEANAPIAWRGSFQQLSPPTISNIIKQPFLKSRAADLHGTIAADSKKNILDKLTDISRFTGISQSVFNNTISEGPFVSYWFWKSSKTHKNVLFTFNQLRFAAVQPNGDYRACLFIQAANGADVSVSCDSRQGYTGHVYTGDAYKQQYMTTGDSNFIVGSEEYKERSLKLSGDTLLIPWPEYSGIQIFDINRDGYYKFVKTDNSLGYASNVTISEDNKLVLQIDRDGTFYVYSFNRTHKILQGVSIDDEYIIYNDDGYYDASPEGAQFVYRYFPGMQQHFAFAQFDSVYHRPDLIRAIARGETVPPPPAPILAPPVVSFKLDPDAGKAGSFTAHGNVTSTADLRTLRVFVDGAPVDELSLSGRQAPIERSIQVPDGKHFVTLAAYDSQGFSSVPSSVDVPAVTGGREKGRLFYVGVAVDQYQNAPEKSLKYATSDMQLISETLQRGASAQYRGFEPTPITDANASAKAILAALEQAVSRAGIDDTIIVSFAGHGDLGQDGKYYFMSSDANWSDIAGTALAWDRVSAVLSRSHARILVLLDACHSGLASNETVVPNDTYAAELMRDRKAGMAVLAASKGRQLSQERGNLGGGHGLFSHAVSQALGVDRRNADTSGDGIVDLEELYRYVKFQVANATRDKDQKPEQTPWMPRNEFIGAVPIL